MIATHIEGAQLHCNPASVFPFCFPVRFLFGRVSHNLLMRMSATSLPVCLALSSLFPCHSPTCGVLKVSQIPSKGKFSVKCGTRTDSLLNTRKSQNLNISPGVSVFANFLLSECISSQSLHISQTARKNGSFFTPLPSLFSVNKCSLHIPRGHSEATEFHIPGAPMSLLLSLI